MANNAPEQELIDEFVAHLQEHTDKRLKIVKEINAKCKSKEFADVEFVSQEQIHWVVEAKSDKSDDRYNTVHKVFGELLKETGRDNRENCRYAILIPHDAVAFYSNAFRAIDKTKFLEFGKLIPIATVFTSDSNGIKEFSWQEFYEHK